MVPQQHAWVVERLGRFYAVLQPGLNFVIPFVDRVAYRARPARNSARCARRRSASRATTRSCRSTASSTSRSPIPKLASLRLVELRARDHATRADHAAQHHRPHGTRTRRSRSASRSTCRSSAALDQAAAQLGREGAALRDQGPDAAGGNPARDAGADHRRAREARGDRDVRGRVASSRSTSPSARARLPIAKSEGEKQAEINIAQGEAQATLINAEANASAIRQIAAAIESQGGLQSVNMQDRRALHQRLRAPRQDQQHADRAVQLLGHGRA